MIARAALPFVFLVLAGSAAQAQVDPASGRHPWLALDVEGGVAYRTAHDDHWVGAYRAAAGLAMIDPGGFSSLTATVGYQPRPAVAFGLSGEVVRFASGLGFSAGGSVDTDRVWSVSAGPSLSLLRLQGVLCFDEPRTKAVMLSLRVPVGVIFYALAHRPGG